MKARMSFLPFFLSIVLLGADEVYKPSIPEEKNLQQARERRRLWENNSLGKESWVPLPWTPVKLEGQIVSVWGRKYIFSNSLFPVQIESKGTTLLHRPIFLEIKTEKEHTMVYSGKMHVVSQTEEKVVLTATAETAGVNIKADTEIEFDGMAKVFLKIAPLEKPVKIEKLALRIPVCQNLAKYYHWEYKGWDPSISYSGKIPEEGISGSFKYLVWVGDEDRGIAWFASDKENWENQKLYEEVRIFRHKSYNDWNIRINFIDSLYELNQTKTIVFGYQATPVKPMPEKYKHLSFKIIWHWARGYLDPIPGEAVTLNPKTKTTLEKAVKCEAEDTIPLLALAGGACAHSDYQGYVLPERWLYAEEWSGEKDTRINFPLNDWAGHVYYGPARLDTSFQDFMVYYINELIEKYNIQGIYFDGHGSPLWAARDFLKRVYKLFRRRHPEQTFILVHSSTQLQSPVLAFADFQWNGENFNAGILRVGAHYTEVLPIDRILAEYTGRQWGWVPYFLPELDEYYRKLIAPTREMIALLQVHDVFISGAWCHYPTFNHFKKVMREFDIADTVFSGYWEQPVFHTNSQVKISIYRHRKGKKILLFAANLTDKIQETVVSLDRRKLGFSPDYVRDVENDFPLLKRNGKLQVFVNSMDYRIIEVGEK